MNIYSPWRPVASLAVGAAVMLALLFACSVYSGGGIAVETA